MVNDKIRIIIVDDHDVVREGLKQIISKIPDFYLIAEANDGLAALDLVRELKPDVIVLDNKLQTLDGIEVARQIRKMKQDFDALSGLMTKVIILTMHSEEVYVRRAFAVGASGYVLKDDTNNELECAIRRALLGERYMSETLWAEASGQLYGNHTSRLKYEDILASLTDREREVFNLVVRDHSNTQIGKMLQISGRTVETHRIHMMAKLGIKNVRQLTRFAVKHKLIQVDESGRVI